MKNKLPLCGVELIKEFEGFYSNAYPDPRTGAFLEQIDSTTEQNSNAYPDPRTGALPITIGYGSTRKLDGSDWRLGDTISKKDAVNLLLHQLENDYLPLLTNIPAWVDLNENQRGAILSFGYNLGASFYWAGNFDSIRNMLDTRNWSIAQSVFIKYRNPGSNVEAGLLRRRKAEAKLFLKAI